MIFDPFIISNCIYIENSNLVLNYTSLNLVSGLPIWFDFIIFFYPKDLSIDILFDLFMQTEKLTIIEEDRFEFDSYTDNFRYSNCFEWFYQNFYHVNKYLYIKIITVIPLESFLKTILSYF